ncbi:MAG: acetate--CoA ligase [Desulfitobacteriaceae bacterium]
MSILYKNNDLIPPHVKEFLRFANDDPEGFWEKAVNDASADIHWFKKWDKVFTHNYPTYEWFSGGLTNISYNCVDYNVIQGRGGKAAIVAESGETGETHTITYAQLLVLVKKYAAAMRGLGVKKGDRVAVYMPMGIESITTLLACARVGAIHVAIFAGFSAGAVADRLEITGAKYMFVQDGSLRRSKPFELKSIIDDALVRMPGIVEKVVVLKSAGQAEPTMVQGRDLYWDEWLALGEGQSSEVEQMEANEPLFLLPTSGTTSKPKVTVHKHGGYQVWVYSMAKWIYGLQPEDVWFCTSDIGWIVGHSYNVYGPLLCGCTNVIYEGTPDYPQKDMWWQVVAKNKATAMWLSPTGIRALMSYGIEHPRNNDISSVKRVFSAGETLNPPAWEWLQKEVFEDRIPVIDHMWQTETGGPAFANFYGLGMIPIKPGSAGIPVPGVSIEVVNEKDGSPVPAGEKGIVTFTKPFPGLIATLWENPERYVSEYWEKTPQTMKKWYLGDAAHVDEDGYVWFAGRSDEVIKIAAHRIGTVEIESALISHPAVVEAGVSGVPDELRGEVASAFIVLTKGTEGTDALKKELTTHVRTTMGPIVVIGTITFVSALPKTRSGKIMRRVMKALLMGQDLGDVSTMEEGASIEEIKAAIQGVSK